MKNKAPLSLIELLSMLLVFALSAALCLQVYVLSGQISRRCEARGEAATAVQNTAEVLKYCKGDASKYSVILGGNEASGCWKIGFSESWDPASLDDAFYCIGIFHEDTGLPTLGRARVSALSCDGEELFSVIVSWQEVAHEQA